MVTCCTPPTTMKKNLFRSSIAALSCSLGLALTPALLRAADHGDGPQASNDPAADIGDVFLFLDPTDNTKVCFQMTMRGFIVPAEAVNLGIFDPSIVYRFMVETNGDAVADSMISINFSPKTSNAIPQTATVTMTRGTTTVFSFTAPATLPTLADTANAAVVTTDGASGVSFFGGIVDDPFFFDIIGFNRFQTSILAGAPDVSQLNRARDSFAGYNTMSLAVRVPISLLQAQNNKVGVYGTTLRAARHFEPTVINVSTRGRVDTGANVLIGGFVIGGSSPKKVILRGIGPSLTARGVAGALADPRLTLYNSSGTVLAVNDNWQDTQAAEIMASGFAPSNTLESAIIATLAPGAYTMILSGMNGGTGVGLVEGYDLNTTAPGGIDLASLHVVDRMGQPGVNVVLTPFKDKDDYNNSTPMDDAAGKFAADITTILNSLGTNAANQAILAGLAITTGDYLRLDLTIANSGPGGGNNAPAAYPNGRRVADDTINTFLSVATNQTVSTDNVNANDVPYRDTFPYFGVAQQPRPNGTQDDNTRN